MFTNRTVAGVAMLFAAVILAHPGPAMAQADVDKAMGVLPPPGASKGIIRPSNPPAGIPATPGSLPSADGVSNNYIATQTIMQDETFRSNLQFNVIETKSDTAKNAINNLR